MARAKFKNLIRHPGRVRRYLMRKYGQIAFNPDGTIKLKYLNMAIQEMERTGQYKRNPGLYKALILARTMKTKWKR